MLSEHKELLAEIELAEERARALYAKGCNVEQVVRLLRQAGNFVKDRVSQYERQAKGGKKSPSPATPPAPPIVPVPEKKS